MSTDPERAVSLRWSDRRRIVTEGDRAEWCGTMLDHELQHRPADIETEDAVLPQRSDSVSDRTLDALAELSKLPSAEWEERLDVGNVPKYLTEGIAAWSASLGRGRLFSKLALLAFLRGVHRLRQRAEHAQIGTARRLLRSARAHARRLDWDYVPEARDGRKRLQVRYATKEVQKLALTLADDLGLSVTTVGTIAILLGLVDVPHIPGEFVRRAEEELRQFAIQLRDRAQEASEITSRLLRQPSSDAYQVADWRSIFKGK
jgi:hypothetical protein